MRTPSTSPSRLRIGRACCTVRLSLAVLRMILPLAASACGYRITGSVRPLPDGIQSLGIPTFHNSTNQFRLEQQLTRAVIREFSVRTRLTVTSNSSGVDAILLGEIRGISSSPVTFGADAFGSTFLVTVQLGVKLVRPRDGAVLWENDDFLFRERYVLNSKVSDFFFEENPALERLASEFATGLASTILHR